MHTTARAARACRAVHKKHEDAAMGSVIDPIRPIGYTHDRAPNAEQILDDHVAEPALMTQGGDR